MTTIRFSLHTKRQSTEFEEKIISKLYFRGRSGRLADIVVPVCPILCPDVSQPFTVPVPACLSLSQSLFRFVSASQPVPIPVPVCLSQSQSLSRFVSACPNLCSGVS